MASIIGRVATSLGYKGSKRSPAPPSFGGLVIPTPLYYGTVVAFAASGAALVMRDGGSPSAFECVVWAVLAYLLALVGQHRVLSADEPPVVWSWVRGVGLANRPPEPRHYTHPPAPF